MYARTSKPFGLESEVKHGIEFGVESEVKHGIFKVESEVKHGIFNKKFDF